MERPFVADITRMRERLIVLVARNQLGGCLLKFIVNGPGGNLGRG